MADDQSNSPTPAPAANQATPASNQNLIIGIVLGALVLLLLLFVINQQLGKAPKEGENYTELKKELEEARNAHTAAQNALGLPPTQNAAALGTKIKQDVDALTNLLATRQADMERLRSSEEAVRSFSTQNTKLRNQLTQAQAASNRVPTLEAQLATMRAEITAAKERLSTAVDSSTVETLRQQLTDARQNVTRLEQEISKLRAEATNMIDRNQLAVIQAQITPLEETNRILRAELQKLRAEADRSKLFVTRDRLSPRAQKLFAALVLLEQASAIPLAQSYEQIGQRLNTRVVESATFKTGSAALDIEHEDHIKTIALNAPENAFFLVVGYASKTGDLQNNRELSAKRATRVASVVNYLKKNGQDVQAVYLGETERFGKKAAPNQLCEIWEIRP